MEQILIVHVEKYVVLVVRMIRVMVVVLVMSDHARECIDRVRCVIVAAVEIGRTTVFGHVIVEIAEIGCHGCRVLAPIVILWQYLHLYLLLLCLIAGRIGAVHIWLLLRCRLLSVGLLCVVVFRQSFEHFHIAILIDVLVLVLIAFITCAINR